MPTLIAKPPVPSRKWRILQATTIPLAIVVINPILDGLSHRHDFGTFSYFATLLGGAIFAGLLFFLMETVRLCPRLELEGDTFASYRGGKRPHRVFKASQVKELRAEVGPASYTRLIYLDNCDIVSYNGSYENVFELDQQVMDLTGLTFTSFQTGKTVDLVAATEELRLSRLPKSKAKA